MVIKEKNLSIELLKFFAVIIVANSHMDILYGKYDIFATGGAIGDALFFFVSGFTIFLGRFGRFDNWYKRRIKRIYPSIIAWAIFMSFFYSQLNLFQYVKGWDWFITCIMLYYIALFFIHKYFSEKPFFPFIFVTLAVLVWYLFEDSSKFFMYGFTYFKWLHFFFFMLMGAYIGNKTIKFQYGIIANLIILFLSLFTFYGFIFFVDKSQVVAHLQVFSLFPLMVIVVSFYNICGTKKAIDLMRTKIGYSLRFIGGLCLESYIVQRTIIRNQYLSDLLSPLFPLNLLITFIIIIILAYFIRCLARIVSQTFEKDDYDWNAVFRVVD